MELFSFIYFVFSSLYKFYKSAHLCLPFPFCLILLCAKKWGRLGKKSFTGRLLYDLIFPLSFSFDLGWFHSCGSSVWSSHLSAIQRVSHAFCFMYPQLHLYFWCCWSRNCSFLPLHPPPALRALWSPPPAWVVLNSTVDDELTNEFNKVFSRVHF